MRLPQIEGPRKTRFNRKKMKNIPSDKIKELDAIFAKARKAIISTHAHPDGDAIGSSTALLKYLRRRGIDARILLPDPCPETLEFAIGEDVAGFVEAGEENAGALLSDADLLVSIDYNTPGRTECLEEYIRAFNGVKVLIDHHLFPETAFYSLVISEEEVSSASELLYYILKGMGDVDSDPKKIGPRIGTSLLLGMTTDSNNFANSTYPTTLQMAGELVDAGVDRDALLGQLYQTYRENRFRMMGYYLSKRLKITPKGVAYAVLTASDLKRFDIREGETEGFVNMPLGIAEVRLSILLKQDKDRIRVSLRSKPGTSANLCARTYFHGGGHELAAGGRLCEGVDFPSIADAAAYIEECTEKFFAE